MDLVAVISGVACFVLLLALIDGLERV